jgi:hypothetical protein
MQAGTVDGDVVDLECGLVSLLEALKQELATEMELFYQAVGAFVDAPKDKAALTVVNHRLNEASSPWLPGLDLTADTVKDFNATEKDYETM